MRIVGVDHTEITFGDTLKFIRSIASRLEAEGIAFGDRVALIGENHPNWALAYLGTILRGAVCVPLDPQGEIETLKNFLENSEAKLAFISSDQLEKFQKINQRLKTPVPAVVWHSPAVVNEDPPPASNAAANPSQQGGLAPAAHGDQDFHSWIHHEPQTLNPELPSGSDTALLNYTSGTTGTPKGVPLTHGNIIAELDGINEVLHFSNDERILSLLPLFHAYLQIVNLWVATTYGCEVGYLKELTPAELGEAMKQFKPTILTTVPRLWYLFHKKIFDAVKAKPRAVQIVFKTLLAANGRLRDTFGVNLGEKFFSQVHESFGGRLRVAVSAGSRFDEDVARDFHKLGFSIIQGYGLTETSGAATATHESDNRVGSVGKPMAGAEICIGSPDKDGVGEVLIRGGMVFSGYYRNPEATAEAFTPDGWFRSGDLGIIDKDGHLHIVGRAKDVIVLPSGKNVHPEDIEVHYLRSPLVEEMAIIGISDAGEQRAGAEKLAAVVVPDFNYLRQEKIANSKEAVRHALDNLGRELPEYQRVRDYIIRAEPLPRTATRKIKRFELKKEIETGQIAHDAADKSAWEFTDADREVLAAPSAGAVAAAIKQNAKDASVIHPKMNLEIDLGLDSLARAETFAALEFAFATEFTADEAARALTVADLIQLTGPQNDPAHLSPEGGLAPAPAIEPGSNWAAIIRTADPSLPEVQTVLRSRPVFITFAWSVYRLFNLFCRAFMRLEVHGLENLKSMERPFLICPNHQSFLDPFVLCSNYPLSYFRHTFHVGASEFFSNRPMAFLARLLNVVPVDPDTQLMKAMKAGAIGLKHGKILNIYPEGERAFDGRLHEFKKGAAILSAELGLPILPVALDGLHKVWPRRSWRIRPAKVKISIGKPLYPDQTTDYAELTARLRDTIASMIAEMRSER
jgi:long-chain acyl-CoA synthetase